MTQIDLSQLGLTAGNHDIQVVAKATGYLDSEITPSGQIIYNPQPMPTTKAYLSNGWLGILVENGFDLTSVDSVRFTSNSSLISGLSKIADVGMTEDDNIECYFNNGELIVYSSDLIECFNQEYPNSLLFSDGLHSLNSMNRIYFDNFDTSEMTSMTDMFKSLNNITHLDLSNFDTTNVTDMSYMFQFCYNLYEIEFGENFITSNVTTFRRMFQNCQGLIAVDISNFDVSSVTDFRDMFSGDNTLRYILVNAGTDWSSSTAVSTSMFAQCYNLPNYDGISYDIAKAFIGSSGYFTDKTSISYPILSQDLTQQTLQVAIVEQYEQWKDIHFIPKGITFNYSLQDPIIEFYNERINNNTERVNFRGIEEGTTRLYITCEEYPEFSSYLNIETYGKKGEEKK